MFRRAVGWKERLAEPDARWRYCIPDDQLAEYRRALRNPDVTSVCLSRNAFDTTGTYAVVLLATDQPINHWADHAWRRIMGEHRVHEPHNPEINEIPDELTNGPIDDESVAPLTPDPEAVASDAQAAHGRRRRPSRKAADDIERGDFDPTWNGHDSGELM